MGIGSAKRAASKKQDKTTETERVGTPVRARRAAQRAPKSGGGSPFTTPKSSTKKSSGFTSKLPNEEQRRSNGRKTGRNLIIWSRPRMTEKLLLHIHYECSRHKIHVPWDAIAHRLHPGSSGQSVLQHINRLRKDVAVEGHLVPPIPTRHPPGRDHNNKIRGYVRDEEGEDTSDMRPVFFDEEVEDRKFGIPGAFVDYDDVEDKPMSYTPAHDVKNESPRSPTPIRRKHPYASADRREMKTSPYGKNTGRDHAEGTYPPPPHMKYQNTMSFNYTREDDPMMHHSPELSRACAGRDVPSGSRSTQFENPTFSYAHGHYRPGPMSADRPRHPAFTQGGDPFFGTDGLRQTATEHGLTVSMDYGNQDLHSLFAMPAMPGTERMQAVDPFSLSCAPQPEQMEMGRAETLSPGGTHSQSSDTSVDDFAKVAAPNMAGESFESFETIDLNKSVDLDKIPNSY